MTTVLHQTGTCFEVIGIPQTPHLTPHGELRVRTKEGAIQVVRDDGTVLKTYTEPKYRRMAMRNPADLIAHYLGVSPTEVRRHVPTHGTGRYISQPKLRSDGI